MFHGFPFQADSYHQDSQVLRTLSVTLSLHESITQYKPDGWRNNKIKRKRVRKVIENVLKEYGIDDEDEIDRIYNLVKNQNEY